MSDHCSITAVHFIGGKGQLVLNAAGHSYSDITAKDNEVQFPDRVQLGFKAYLRPRTKNMDVSQLTSFKVPQCPIIFRNRDGGTLQYVPHLKSQNPPSFLYRSLPVLRCGGCISSLFALFFLNLCFNLFAARDIFCTHV